MSERAGNPLARESAGVSARAAGFAFVARTNRWMVAGAVAVAGGLTAFTAHAFHARPTAVAPSTAAHSARSGRAGSARSQNAGASLAPPSQPPVASSPTPAPVVSGGS